MQETEQKVRSEGFEVTVVVTEPGAKQGWADCPHCLQSCTGSYGGKVLCVRCWRSGRRVF